MLKRGTQVALIPPYAKGSLKEKLKHRDTRYGFITTISNDAIWCRFWSRYDDTLSAVEMVAPNGIVEHESHPQSEVDALLETF